MRKQKPSPSRQSLKKNRPKNGRTGKKLPLVHIRLDYEEAREAKSVILTSQLLQLKMIKAIRGYRTARLEELRLKQKTRLKALTLSANLKKLIVSLPYLEVSGPLPIQRNIKSNSKTASASAGISLFKKTGNEDIEKQLEEVSSKLREIGEKQKRKVF